MSCAKKTKVFCCRGTDIIWSRGQLLPMPKMILLFFFTLNVFLGSTVFVGWPSLLKIYKAEGYYSWLCHTGNLTASNSTLFNITSLNTTLTNATSVITCSAQDDRFNIVYTVAAGVSYFGSMFFGIMLDLLGPKVSGTLANCSILLGSLFLIFYQCK